MNTPLLFEYNVQKTRKVLIAIYTSPTNEITASETSEIKDFMQSLDEEVDFIWGAFFDDNLGDEVKITLLATCADDNVIPEQIDNKLRENAMQKIRDKSILYLEDLDDLEVLKNIQDMPTYQRTSL